MKRHLVNLGNLIIMCWLGRVLQIWGLCFLITSSCPFHLVSFRYIYIYQHRHRLKCDHLTNGYGMLEHPIRPRTLGHSSLMLCFSDLFCLKAVKSTVYHVKWQIYVTFNRAGWHKIKMTSEQLKVISHRPNKDWFDFKRLGVAFLVLAAVADTYNRKSRYTRFQALYCLFVPGKAMSILWALQKANGLEDISSKQVWRKAQRRKCNRSPRKLECMV